MIYGEVTRHKKKKVGVYSVGRLTMAAWSARAGEANLSF